MGIHKYLTIYIGTWDMYAVNLCSFSGFNSTIGLKRVASIHYYSFYMFNCCHKFIPLFANRCTYGRQWKYLKLKMHLLMHSCVLFWFFNSLATIQRFTFMNFINIECLWIIWYSELNAECAISQLALKIWIFLLWCAAI